MVNTFKYTSYWQCFLSITTAVFSLHTKPSTSKQWLHRPPLQLWTDSVSCSVHPRRFAAIPRRQDEEKKNETSKARTVPKLKRIPSTSWIDGLSPHILGFWPSSFENFVFRVTVGVMFQGLNYGCFQHENSAQGCRSMNRSNSGIRRLEMQASYEQNAHWWWTIWRKSTGGYAFLLGEICRYADSIKLVTFFCSQ